MSTDTATAARTVTAIRYASEECTRCGGTGRMPYAVYGGVCFRCEGTGSTLTRAGKTAKARVDAWKLANLTVAASTLVEGDRIDDRGSRRTVVSVKTTLGNVGGRSMVGVAGTDSYVETWTYGQTIVETQKVSFQLAAHAPVVKVWNREQITACAATVAHLSGALIEYVEA